MTRSHVPILAMLLVVGAHAVSAQSALAQNAPARWRGTPDLTIGGAEADDDASFGRISGITVDRAGRIFVADAQDNQVRVFSPAGALLTRIGRMGSGPLEFKRLATIGIGPDGLLWTRDEGNARMLGIDVSATPARGVKNVPLQQFTGGSRMPMIFEPDGSMVDEAIWYDRAMSTFRPLRLRRTSTGTVSRTDTLPVPPGAFAGVHRVTKVQKNAAGKEIGMAESFYWQPFGPQWMRAYGPGGLRAEVVGSQYAVRVFDANGRLVRTLARTVPKVGLSAREKREADSTLAELRQHKPPFGVPSAKAPVVGLWWSQDGQLWVERAVADGRPREADVFDRDGRLVASAEWPRDIDLWNGMPVVNGTTVTAVAYDDDQVQRVVRLRFR